MYKFLKTIYPHVLIMLCEVFAKKVCSAVRLGGVYARASFKKHIGSRGASSCLKEFETRVKMCNATISDEYVQSTYVCAFVCT